MYDFTRNVGDHDDIHEDDLDQRTDVDEATDHSAFQSGSLVLPLSGESVDVGISRITAVPVSGGMPFFIITRL